MAVHIRAALGPISVVGEWNGAVQAAKFVDDAKSHVRMIPNAWQVTLGYQFDWNPWVESIGAQGTYFTVGYSESYDLMGVSFNPDRAGNPAGPVERVGFVPRRRFVVSLGEWVLENLRVAVEYSLNWDYPVSKGGTGQNASGVFSTVTFTF
jgi:hypothetical protein